jgi:glycosyltransferase involved in cell wall biosynthesis
MSYHANITAAKHLVHDIMPLVWARKPDVNVMIVGKDPPRDVRSLENSRASTNGNGDAGRVRVTGTVPDLRPYLLRASVAVAPLLYGAGIQNKVLEAMSCGTPVVASSKAISALNVRENRDLLVGDNAEVFARRVLDLLENPQLRDEVGRAGRRYVETHHSWDNIAASLESAYLETIRSTARQHVCV